MMNRTSLIDMDPFPFRFNPWKHHLHWVKTQLKNIQEYSFDSPIMQESVDLIRSINSNYVDVYTGILVCTQLMEEVNAIIKQAGIICSEDFLIWINESGFKTVTLSDDSRWILRKGTEEAFYLHLHPARNAPHIIRLHGNSWKTAIIMKLFYPHHETMDLPTINELRKTKLQLSPIKSLEHSQRLTEAMNLLGKD